ncbi:hypothetical protein [Billgrantia ethanolica]|uniref:Uncharacterized protein n=1 Tax=Billgrantia ethanolica TaxID=2733486 RepID=A0ABS9A938_9GAMM|nr:hypothetical protein [Halomonas ethanolica]MCE8005327.1 hypothetical protein [Halomonas ethanolica]
MSSQRLPDISQLTFLLALAQTMPPRSQDKMHPAQLPPLLVERARQEARNLLGIDVTTEGRE